MIYGPDGSELSKPIDPAFQGLVYAEIDLDDRISAKQVMDLVGHYSRPDLLCLQVTQESATQVRLS